MNAIGIETIPTTWDDTQDGAFFRLIEGLFTPAFTFGAGVLLASYDDQWTNAAAPAVPAASETLARPISIPAR